MIACTSPSVTVLTTLMPSGPCAGQGGLPYCAQATALAAILGIAFQQLPGHCPVHATFCPVPAKLLADTGMSASCCSVLKKGFDRVSWPLHPVPSPHGCLPTTAPKNCRRLLDPEGRPALLRVSLPRLSRALSVD